MGKKAAAIVAGLVVAASFIPAAAAFGSPDPQQTTCAPVPASVDAKDVHVGSQTVHVGSRSQIKVCATTDVRVNVTPTITFFKSCGDPCFAVRMARVEAYQDLEVELTWHEDGADQATTVDPDATDLSKDVGDICVSNHADGTADPCVVTLVSPSNLTARGRRGRINLSWTAASEAYGRTTGLQYEVWMSETGAPDSFALVGKTATTKFAEPALARGTQHYYYVVAFDSDGNRSGGSNVATAIAK